MKCVVREALALIALSLVFALLYNAASPTGIKLNRKPIPAGQEQPGQAR